MATLSLIAGLGIALDGLPVFFDAVLELAHRKQESAISARIDKECLSSRNKETVKSKETW